MTNTAHDMRKLVLLLESTDQVQEQTEPLNELRGWAGSLRGYMAGIKQRRALFNSWKFFLRKYRRDGTVADIRDWLKYRRMDLPRSELNRMMQRADINYKTPDEKVSESQLKEFFAAVGYHSALQNPDDDDAVPAASSPPSARPEGEPVRRAPEPSAPPPRPPAAPAVQRLDKENSMRLLTAIGASVDDKYQKDLMKWLKNNHLLDHSAERRIPF